MPICALLSVKWNSDDSATSLRNQGQHSMDESGFHDYGFLECNAWSETWVGIEAEEEEGSLLIEH